MLKNITIKVASVLVLTLLLSNFASAESYINEFNEPNEQANQLDSWTYITADGTSRNIDVYRYCDVGGGCSIVIFDTKNVNELSIEQSKSFFENYKLKEYVNNNQISESLYSIDFGKESLTCEYIAPKFPEEEKNAAIEVGAEKIAPEILPSKAGTLVKSLYTAGKEIGLVKDANFPALLLGASCIGGDYLETTAASYLNSCQAFVVNIRGNRAYEGQGSDLRNCHSDSINKLKEVYGSPDMYFKALETKVGNILQNTGCYLNGLFGNNCSIQNNPTMLDALENKISSLNQAYPNIDPTIIDRLAQDSFMRISNKRTEVESKITELNEIITTNDKRIAEKNSDILLNIENKFLVEPYSFTGAENQNDLAKQKINDARNYQQTYKFNTALKSSDEGKGNADNASLLLNLEETKKRNVNWINVVALVIFIVIPIFIVILILRNRNLKNS